MLNYSMLLMLYKSFYIAKYNNLITDIQYQKLKNIINLNFAYPTFSEKVRLLFNQNNIEMLKTLDIKNLISPFLNQNLFQNRF